MTDDISKVAPFWEWKEQQEARDTKENGGTPLLRSKDWYHREYGVFVQSSKRLGYATFENGKLRVDVGSFLKDNADRLESATTPAEVGEPALRLQQDVVNRFGSSRILAGDYYTADQYAALARQLAEEKAEIERRTSDMIVVGGTALACSQAVKEMFDLHKSQLAEATRRLGEVEVALSDLLLHVDGETCQHEETHRGGAIWTICDGCGRQWADDRGGFKPHEDAPAVARARSALTKEPTK